VRRINPVAAYRRWRLRGKLAPQVEAVEAFLRSLPQPDSRDQPVFFFNASTRIHMLSLNGAFGLLASWALRAGQVPVRYLVCDRGLAPCVLGTNRTHPHAPPPCSPCMALSRTLFPPHLVDPLHLHRDLALEVLRDLTGRSLSDLETWEFNGRPLGSLCLPSVRWFLRRHHLLDAEPAISIFSHYLASAASLSLELEAVFARLSPRALALFNGTFYPEALARRIARERAIPVVTHEVGLASISAFFTRGEATFREASLNDGWRLDQEQSRRLDRYLEDRFRGSFTMAGIRFWERMESIPEWLLEERRRFRDTVTVFTNVVFDTSQIHANHIFDDMFEWLDDLAAAVGRHRQTLFVFRAHPDEDRPGKESQESVEAWFWASPLASYPNAVLIGPAQPISSYDLVRQSKLVLVYSSSVGLEASVLGVPVLCAGRARYTQVPSVFRAESRAEYTGLLERFLREEKIEVPSGFRETARASLYAELFEESLDLSEFLEPMTDAPGMVEFRRFLPERLLTSPPLRQIRRGFVDGEPFSLRADPEDGEPTGSG
jgi:hypothetical protein